MIWIGPYEAYSPGSIVLQEAKSGSLIENVVTTNDKLYQSTADTAKPIVPDTKEVLNYREQSGKVTIKFKIDPG